MDVVANEKLFADRVVLDKFGNENGDVRPELRLLLSEIRNRDEMLSALRKSALKTLSRAKWLSGIESILWLISAAVFSALVILYDRKTVSRDCSIK